MATRITACILQKGGTGKTTTAHALSVGLSRRGFRVLACDLDSQGNLSQSMGADTDAKGLFEVLNGEPVAALIQTTEQGDILASSQRLSVADKTFIEFGMEYLLAEALAPIKDKYDYIVLDCPPQLGILTVHALVAATDLIIPITADMYAMTGLGMLFNNINKVKVRANPNLKIDGILITRNNRSILTRDIRDNIASISSDMSTRMYMSTIRDSVAIREAQAHKTSIFDYAPESNPAIDYNNFIDEYLGVSKNG